MKFEKRILKDLYESVNGLFQFPFLLFIQKYKDKGILEYEDNRIYLTKEGKDIILKQALYKKSSEDKFSNIPSEFIVSKLKINEPYLPNIKTVSADILKN
jgi:hypothetical protein